MATRSGARAEGAGATPRAGKSSRSRSPAGGPKAKSGAERRTAAARPRAGTARSSVQEEAATEAATRGTRAHGAASAAPAHEAIPAALAGLSPWLQMWQEFAQMASAAPMKMPTVGLATDRMLDLQREYMQRLAGLWTDFVEHPEKTTEPIRDSRFADAAWQQNSVASFYARAYLLNSEFMTRLADSVQADRKTKNRVKFAVGQFVDAAAPSNYLALNPKAQKTLLESSGESLKQGMQNLLTDIGKGKITMTDESAFEVGKNVATTEGAIVFENALMQLIQYKPLTAKVYERPLVMVPPSINKFYIMDLQPENSLIRYAVEQGHTVFVVSWKNPKQPESKMTWDDYLELGPIAALRVAQEISGSKQVNSLGFCVGGTILVSGLAVMYARGEDPVSSVTLMTSLIDFEDTGVLDIFVDEAHVRMREKQLGKGGLMNGKELANTFSSLRPNDLVWNYVVSNYLEGRQPPAFDLLYWNGDSTNLPGPMYTWYLRNTYLENNLKIPNKLTCCGVPVDLGRIKVPTYAFAAREDHIVPWKAAYASARVLPGSNGRDVRFVLGASGHIAGSINPASKNKRSYWAANGAGKGELLPADSDTWLASAKEHAGSWWIDWARWLAPLGKGQKPAPKAYGSSKYKVIEPAPGRYVQEKV